MRISRFLISVLLLLTVEAAYSVDDNPSTHKALTNTASTEQVAASLVASVDAVHPGSEIYLGVNQRIIPNWHTYWTNPGDSGLPTTIEWSLPSGASAGDILWPIPSRFSLGSITNYGYSNEVTLLSKVRVPVNASVGETFAVQALVDWLVCNEECIPQQVQLSLSLPIVAASTPTGVGSPLILSALAQLPVDSPWPVELKPLDGGFSLEVGLTLEQIKQIKDIWFYPADWGVLTQNIPQPYKVTKNGLAIQLKSGEAPLKANQALNGVLVISEQTDQGLLQTGFSVTQVPQQAATPTNNIGFISALLLALLGGIILNLMPCVFPVLSLKALSLVSHANQSPRQIRLQGWVYTLGVLASFTFLAVLLIVLKAGGAQIGWGFQFQSPIFVLSVAYLMFVVGLSLSGVFIVGGSIAGAGSSLADRGGYSGSFFTGVLATIVATPCTAPFMAAALGYALAQPAPTLLAIFLSLGFGLALPYLLLANWPRLQRWLPRPGLWMERTKEVFAFPMYATAAWLVWVLAQQAGPNAVIVALSGMILLGFAAWLYNTTRNTSERTERVGAGFVFLLVALAFILGYKGLQANSSLHEAATNQQEKNWEPYSAERLDALLAEGKPVFLNFTAAWCISCLVNERVALSDSKVVEAFETSGITYLKGDWTKRDEKITQFLTTFGRSGVPLYVFYPAGKNVRPVELPQVLTPDIVLNAISPSL